MCETEAEHRVRMSQVMFRKEEVPIQNDTQRYLILARDITIHNSKVNQEQDHSKSHP